MAFTSGNHSTFLFLAFALLLSFTITEARDHLVGGKAYAWKVPSSDSESLNKWAEQSRFKIGDSLVWKYDGKKDSVVQVTREAYLSCDVSKPIAAHNDGETKVVLDKSGPYYFISGSKSNCDKGEKLIVVVMAPRKGSVAPSLAPAPAPALGFDGPAVAPTSAGAGLQSGLMMMVVVGVLVGFMFM